MVWFPTKMLEPVDAKVADSLPSNLSAFSAWDAEPKKLTAVTLPLTFIEPVNWEPLAADWTLNPNCGVTDAVTEPVVNNVVNNASGVNAERGISNNPAPLPLYIEPDANVTLPLISIEPVNSEPLAIDFTTNPLSASVDAVTEPVAIIVATKASGVKAERGISNNPAPLPLNIDDDIPLWKNDSPLTKRLELNVVLEPLIITLPVNWEPLAADLTINPASTSVDAVTEPVAIIVATNASGVNAERGISNKPLPLPLNIEAVTLPPTLKLFNNSTEPVNCCLSVISSPNMFEPDE